MLVRFRRRCARRTRPSSTSARRLTTSTRSCRPRQASPPHLPSFLRKLQATLNAAIPVFRDLRVSHLQARPQQRPQRLAEEAARRQQRAVANGQPDAQALNYEPARCRLRGPYTPDLLGFLSKFGEVTALLRRRWPLRARPARLGRTSSPTTPARASSTRSRPRSSSTSSTRSELGPFCALPRRCHAAERRLAEPDRSPVPRGRPAQRRLQPERGAPRTMRRILIIVLALSAGVAILATGTGIGGDYGSYEVRGIFDNAAFLVKGEEVRVAGAKVGTVAEVDVTHQRRAGERGRRARSRQGRGRDEDRRRRLPGLPHRRLVPDPAAVADRREVRRVPAHRSRARRARPRRRS